MMHMTHLPYIAASYGLFLATVVIYATTAARRLTQATRRLRAVDPRAPR